MSKSNLLKVVVVIGLSLLLVANLASVVLADDATYGWDDPTATTTQTNTTNTTTNTATGNTTYSNTASTTNSSTTNITTATTGSTSISTGNATTTLNTSTNETSNEVNSLAYTGVESNSVLVVVILVGAIIAGYSLKKVKEYNNI